MRLFKTEPLASLFESAGGGDASGFEESSATNIQRGSAKAPGLSIVGDALEAAADAEAGAWTDGEDAEEKGLHGGASVAPSTHQGWHPAKVDRRTAHAIAARALRPIAHAHCWSSQQWHRWAPCRDGRAKIAIPFA